MTDLMEDEETTECSEREVYEMPRGIAVDYEGIDQRGYVEVGVEAGDNLAEVYLEDLDSAILLRLSQSELNALIDALQQAREIVALNS